MEEVQYLQVGYLTGAHGVRGEARVYVETDYPDIRFANQAKLFLQHPSLAKPIPLTVAATRPHKQSLLVQFAELTVREEILSFRGGRLLVPITETVEDAEEDAYYFHQIIGCEVVTQEGERLGRVKEIFTYPANDVWVVHSDESNKEWLIPYIDDVVKEVDISRQRIMITWVEGLETSG